MSTLPTRRLSPEEYLEIERKAEYKSEYYNGEMFAMSGGTRAHSRLAVRLNSLFELHLAGRSCDNFNSDMRVLVEKTGLYTYPDVSVACGDPKFADASNDVLLNPTLIVEVLSPGTQRYDRGEKVHQYRTIPSLIECVLVAQDEPQVELYRRQPDGSWLLLDAKGMDASVELTSIGYVLRLGELYRNILPEAR